MSDKKRFIKDEKRTLLDGRDDLISIAYEHDGLSEILLSLANDKVGFNTELVCSFMYWYIETSAERLRDIASSIGRAAAEHGSNGKNR